MIELEVKCHAVARGGDNNNGLLRKFQIREERIDNFRQNDIIKNINRTLKKIIRYIPESIHGIF